MGLKDEVYAAIREDFERNGGSSFLMDYLKREKERRLEKLPAHPDRAQKPDTYIRLLLCYQQIRGGGDRGGKAAYLRELASELARNPKLNLGSRAQQILEYRTGMDGVFKGERRNMPKYEQMLSQLRSDPPELEMAELEELHQDVSFRLLILESKALLYDAIDAGKQEAGGTKASGRKPKVDRMLDLFCDYLRWQGISTLPAAAAVSGESTAAADSAAEDWKRLYAILNSSAEKKEARCVMLPVRVDPRTGASVYIIGQNYFFDSKTVKKKAKGAACCCVGLYINSMAVEDGNEQEGTFPGIHCAWEDYNGGTLEEMVYPNIQEALVWYERVLRPSAAQNFRDENGKAPEGCPEALRSYFSAF